MVFQLAGIFRRVADPVKDSRSSFEGVQVGDRLRVQMTRHSKAQRMPVQDLVVPNIAMAEA